MDTTTIPPTRARLALLHEAATGNLVYGLDHDGHWCAHLGPGFGRRVTARADELTAAGWLVLDPADDDPDRYPRARQYLLTEQGAAVLAAGTPQPFTPPACRCGCAYATHPAHGDGAERRAGACTDCDQCLGYRPAVTR